MGVERLPVLSVRGEECVYSGSRTKVGVRRGECDDATSKPGPFKNRRVRHPELQRLSFRGAERCATRRVEVGSARPIISDLAHLFKRSGRGRFNRGKVAGRAASDGLGMFVLQYGNVVQSERFAPRTSIAAPFANVLDPM